MAGIVPRHRPDPRPRSRPMAAAEVLEIRDGRIVRGELFYDAEELPKAMAQGTTG